MAQHKSIYVVIGRNVYRTTKHNDPCNGPVMEFYRQFANHEAANSWLWTNHPVQ